jgi:hypothetical protein
MSMEIVPHLTVGNARLVDVPEDSILQFSFDEIKSVESVTLNSPNFAKISKYLPKIRTLFDVKKRIIAKVSETGESKLFIYSGVVHGNFVTYDYSPLVNSEVKWKSYEIMEKIGLPAFELLPKTARSVTINFDSLMRDTFTFNTDPFIYMRLMMISPLKDANHLEEIIIDWPRPNGKDSDEEAISTLLLNHLNEMVSIVKTLSRKESEYPITIGYKLAKTQREKYFSSWTHEQFFEKMVDEFSKSSFEEFVRSYETIGFVEDQQGNDEDEKKKHAFMRGILILINRYI